jgi:Uma2 family endonuclease
MVLEVVSKTTKRKDLVELVEDYALAGVREYWIADALREDLVFRILTLGRDGTYKDTEARRGWLRSPMFDRLFRIRHLPARQGIHDFILDVRRASRA